MIELLLVGGVVAVTMGLAALLALVPWLWLFGAGLVMLAFGVFVGVPAGVWYHVMLYRLAPRAALTRGWWLRPTALHDALGPGERPPVLWWFRLGAAGFGAVVLGAVLLGVGAWRS